jgi:1-acyl-sn-glycerol-3-phosphate acyltransferase
MRLLGWRLINQVPALDKYLVIAAPHTTNWDFFYMLLMRGASGVNFHWVGKDALFRFPMGGVMRWLGGIPVNRRIRANFVDQIVELFKQHKQLVLAIAPEGTRGRSVTWRTGFYYMALGAGVPIAMVGIDYPSKSLEISPCFQPSGDLQADFEIIRSFFRDKRGKYPHLQGEIVIAAE